MKPQVTDKTTAARYKWGENCDSWVMVDTEYLSIKQESMPGGTSEKLHFHSLAQQFFFILKGTATFYVETEKLSVYKQQGLHILPNTKHFIANETHEPLEFLVISQPTTNNDRTLLIQNNLK